MTKSARKWVIGSLAMLTFVVIVAQLDATSIDIAIPALAIGLAAWALSLLRRSVALALFAPPAMLFLLLGYNSQGLARGVAMFMSLASGIALCAAIIGGWAFDRYLQQDPNDT